MTMTGQNFSLIFNIMSDLEGNTSIVTTSNATVPNWLANVQNEIRVLKNTLNKEIGAITNKVNGLSNTLNSKLSVFESEFSTFLNTTFSKIITSINSVIAGNTVTDMTVKPSGMSPNKQLKYKDINSSIQTLMTNYQATGIVTLSGTTLTSTQIINITNMLDILTQIYNLVTTRTMTYKPDQSNSSSSSCGCKCGDITRTSIRNITNMSSSISTLSSNTETLSHNDRILAVGIGKSAQILTSFDMNVGSNGKQPDISLHLPETNTTPLYPVNINPKPIIQRNNFLIELNNRNRNRNNNRNRNRNRRTSITSNSNLDNTQMEMFNSIQGGTQNLINDLSAELANKLAEYNAKVANNTATVEDTNQYGEDVIRINNQIKQLLNDKMNNGNYAYNKYTDSSMYKFGKTFNTDMVKALFGGKDYIFAPKSGPKKLLRKVLSNMNVYTPNGNIPITTTTSGNLSSISAKINSHNGDIMANITMILQDEQIDVNYTLNETQFSTFLSTVGSSTSINTQGSYNEMIIFLFIYLAIYIYSGSNIDNVLNIINTNYDGTNIISSLDPEILTEYVSKLIPQGSISLGADTVGILDNFSGLGMVSKLYSSISEGTNYTNIANSNYSGVTTLKHMFGKNVATRDLTN